MLWIHGNVLKIIARMDVKSGGHSADLPGNSVNNCFMPALADGR